ncbi:MAG: hypothetical protein BWY86_01170 [Candidatus Aminicenantes bacterium ADurb.Bin508]|nr:MAG: hypothetical protein BWY86_01170 [Candidatus Aminicenantes bacterium ADurb.Bin508]
MVVGDVLIDLTALPTLPPALQEVQEKVSLLDDLLVGTETDLLDRDDRSLVEGDVGGDLSQVGVLHGHAASGRERGQGLEGIVASVEPDSGTPFLLECVDGVGVVHHEGSETVEGRKLVVLHGFREEVDPQGRLLVPLGHLVSPVLTGGDRENHEGVGVVPLVEVHLLAPFLHQKGGLLLLADHQEVVGVEVLTAKGKKGEEKEEDKLSSDEGLSHIRPRWLPFEV